MFIKRTVSLLLSLVMIFSVFAPCASITAAADGVDLSDLKKYVDSVPQSEWYRYQDVEVLKTWYDAANEIIQNPEKYDQSYVDNVAKSLESAIDSLKYHTLGLKLNKHAVSVNVDEKTTLVASLTPSNAADEVKWTSSNNNVASVENGTVYVHKYSKNPVTITAASNGYSDSCTVTTLNPVAGVKLDKTEGELFETQSIKLTPSAYGKDSSAATTDTVIWEWDSSNNDVAFVTDDGVVNAKKQGKTDITVTAKGTKHKAKCQITVNELIQITGVKVLSSLTNNRMNMTAGETESFKLSITPTNASIKDFKWTTSNKAVATVSQISSDGGEVIANIKALKKGTAKIEYSTTDGTNKHGAFEVNVLPQISFLGLVGGSRVIAPDAKDKKIEVTIYPSDAGNKNLDYISDNKDVCTVDYDGVLTPKAKGKTTVTVKTKDGSKLSVSCDVRVAEKASSVTIDKKTATLKVGGTLKLKATVKTTDGSSYSDIVSWTTSNSSIVKIDSSGNITALAPGKATLTAKTKDGTNKSASCVVTVTAPMKGVTLPKTKTVGVGESVTIKPTFNPTNASNKGVKWSTNNDKIATVDSKGVVKGKKTGSCIITVKTDDGGFTAKCTVTVVVKTNGIKINKSSVTVAAGKTYTLTATVSPTNATNKTVTWSTSNKKVATVSSKGVVTAVAGGKCTITAKASGGQTAKCTVNVTQKVSGVSLSKKTLTLYKGQVYTLKATVSPSTATNKSLTWSSKNKKIVTVDSSGKLTAKVKGSTVITVKTADGGYTATCTVTVTPKVNVTGITLSKTKVSVSKGKTVTLDATLKPSNASEKGVSWSSNNKNVATVSSSGVVKGVKVGTAIITAKSKDGGYTAKCTVTVKQNATGLKISKTSIKLAKGNSQALYVKFTPSDAASEKIMWMSSNEKVAKVSSNGVVTAVKNGKASITATSKTTKLSAVCNVTVYTEVTKLRMSMDTITVPKGEMKILTVVISPKDATDDTIKWSTSDETVAKVNAAGQVTGLKVGAAVITAKSSNGVKAKCTVEVVQYATSVTLNYASVNIAVGSTKTLVATMKPSSASDRTVKWTSSNKKVVKVSGKGKVTAVAPGEAIITCKSGDGQCTAKCKFIVIQPVTKLTPKSKTVNVKVGKTAKLNITVSPKNATDKTLKYSSSDKEIATVSSKGVVKGIKKGTAKITIKSANGSVSTVCTVNVQKPVKGVSLNKVSLTINNGKKVTLSANIKPKDAGNKKVKWSSSNNDVATVNSKGVVTAVGPGYAVITAKTVDGGYKATCGILVNQPLKSIAFAKKSVTAQVGKTLKLSVTYKPKNASNKTLKWSSSNKNIAKVSQSGVVTGVKKGTVTITAKSVDGGYTIKCTVKVIKKVTKVTLNKSSIVLYLNSEATLKATVTPKDASNKKVTWSSSNSKICKVDSNGNLEPLKPGTIIITVKTADGGKTAKCTVKVERAVTKIKLNKTSLSLKTGKTATLTATISPSNASNKKVTWTSSNKKVATVNSKGVVTAKGRGSATITAKSSNGKTVKCKVTVTQPVTGITLNKNAQTLYIGETATLAATVKPSNANNKAITWSTSDKTVATVTSAGKVTAVKPGTAKITVKTADGGKTAVCTVTVLKHVSSVSLNQTNLTLNRGVEYQLTATVLPADASNKGVTWTSSDSQTVSVSSDGKIKALKPGQAKITVTTKDKALTAVCTVTVVAPVTGVKLSETEKTVTQGEEFILTATVEPEDATNKTVTFSTNNADCVTVSDDGKVTAVAPGEAIITVKTADGEFEATCKVTVLPLQTEEDDG